MFWGDNQAGQLGNRKRSFIESPYPSRKFEYRHNVENVVLGIDSSGVIVEDTGRVKNKSKKKKKKILKVNEVVTSEDELKMRTEAMISKEKDPEIDSRGRKHLGERLRAKFHERVYGKEKADSTKQKSTPKEEPKPSLEELIKKEKEAEKEKMNEKENEKGKEKQA